MWEQRGGWAQREASPSLWSALTSNARIRTCDAAQKERDSTHTNTNTHPPYSGGISSHPNNIILLSAEWLPPWQWVAEKNCTQTDGWGRRGEGGYGRLHCSGLVTTPLPNRWAWATGWACVCVRLHGAGPLPLLSTASSLRLQHATDLVAKVTSCVDGFTSVLITG